jgi:hypothetical protein
VDGLDGCKCWKELDGGFITIFSAWSLSLFISPGVRDVEGMGGVVSVRFSLLWDDVGGF